MSPRLSCPSEQFLARSHQFPLSHSSCCETLGSSISASPPQKHPSKNGFWQIHRLCFLFSVVSFLQERGKALVNLFHGPPDMGCLLNAISPHGMSSKCNLSSQFSCFLPLCLGLAERALSSESVHLTHMSYPGGCTGASWESFPVERHSMKKLAVVLWRKPSGNTAGCTTGFLPTSEVLSLSWVHSMPWGNTVSAQVLGRIWDLQMGRGTWHSDGLGLPAQKWLKSCSTESPRC